MDEIIKTLKGADNEATESPYWLIIDPSGPNMKTKSSEVANCITGPFFCRQDAEDHLAARRYNFSPRTVVWCLSGYWSHKYKTFCREIEIGRLP